MALFMETMNFKDMLEVMMTNMITIKGDKGDPGDPGVPGKAGRTPVKGKDYFTKTEVDGEYVASDVEGAGKGNQQIRLTGKNHVLTTHVEGVKGNNKYWDDLNVSTNYRVVWVGDNYNVLFVSQTNCSISANMIQPNDLEGQMQWQVICKYSDIRVPESCDLPPGIFQ